MVMYGAAADTAPARDGLCNPWLNDWLRTVFGPAVKRIVSESERCASLKSSEKQSW